jgi:hypothetical protein
MVASLIAVFGLAAFDTTGATVLDRIAVVVGKRAIKSSDIDRDIRVTAFLNKEAFNFTPDAKKKAADRLVDQQIIRREIATGEYPRASEADAEGLLNQIRTTRFGGSDARLAAELNRYGLTKAQLKEQLLWQLTVLRFIDERFRPGVQVSDEDVNAYHEAHATEFKGADWQDKIRELLEGEKINQQFEDWLNAVRSRTFIEFHDEGKR